MAKCIALAIFLSTLCCGGVRACTCFFAENDEAALFARNYDWHFEQGVLTVNKRGLQKTAFAFDNPAEWTSKYGSVTFNQYGREFPNDGMNERGLVVAVMWLRETKYPTADARPSVSSAQWLQYQLDTAATVGEVLASDERLRISQIGGGLVHYLVADAQGDCAVIEWIDGERVVYQGNELLAKALTNSNYRQSLAYLKQHQGFGGESPAKESRASLDRFVRASLASKRAAESDRWTVEQAFVDLAGAAQGMRTKWSIVYDVRNRRVQFKTKSSPVVKRLALADLNFAADTPTQVLNLADATAPGDVAPLLVDFETEQNLRQINRAFDATVFLRPWPAILREQIAKYPELQCVPVTKINGNQISDQEIHEAIGASAGGH